MKSLNMMQMVRITTLKLNVREWRYIHIISRWTLQSSDVSKFFLTASELSPVTSDPSDKQTPYLSLYKSSVSNWRNSYGVRYCTKFGHFTWEHLIWSFHFTGPSDPKKIRMSRFLLALSFQTDGLWPCLSLYSGCSQPMLWNELTVLSNFFKNLFSTAVFPCHLIVHIDTSNPIAQSRYSSGRPLCPSSTAVPIFTVRTALPATPFVSERWWVLTSGFQCWSWQASMNSFCFVGVDPFPFLTVVRIFVNMTWSPTHLLSSSDNPESNSYTRLVRSKHLCADISTHSHSDFFWSAVMESPNYVEGVIPCTHFAGLILHLARGDFIILLTSNFGPFG